MQNSLSKGGEVNRRIVGTVQFSIADDLEDCRDGHPVWRGQGWHHSGPQAAVGKGTREADQEAGTGGLCFLC